jgi:signal transduction histidine kinase
MIKTDESIFCNVMRNLLTNAIKFSKGPGTVSIQVRKTSDAIEITVSDTGTGNSKSSQPKLFRNDLPHNSTRSTFNEWGSGPGMILSKEFMEKMNVAIRVNSVFGKASNFTISLPLAK